VQQIPHDTSAFTEGLELAGGVLYEGTGLEGASTIRAVDPGTGTVPPAGEAANELFGEGITVVGATIWQLTYRQGIAIQRDRDTFAELRRASFTGEGLGLCHDAANRLVMSDGTDRLPFRDPQTFQQDRRDPRDLGWPSGSPSSTELECAQGAVFANVWRNRDDRAHRPGQRKRDRRCRSCRAAARRPARRRWTCSTVSPPCREPMSSL